MIALILSLLATGKRKWALYGIVAFFVLPALGVNINQMLGGLNLSGLGLSGNGSGGAVPA